MVAALRLLDVSQRFGDTWVLAHVELTLGRGETLLLTGANGAGKTTLLRLMAGALRPTAGQVVYGEFTARAGPRAALLSHAHHLYEGLSASHNLQLVQRLLGRPTDVAAQLAAVGLGDVGEAPVVTFRRV